MYGVLTTKKSSSDSHLVFFWLLHAPVGVSHIRLLPLIFTVWFLPYMTPAVVSQHICTPFSTISLVSLGNAQMEHFAMFICDDSHILRKKSKKEFKKKKSFSGTVHATSLHDEISYRKISP